MDRIYNLISGFRDRRACGMGGPISGRMEAAAALGELIRGSGGWSPLQGLGCETPKDPRGTVDPQQHSIRRPTALRPYLLSSQPGLSIGPLYSEMLPSNFLEEYLTRESLGGPFYWTEGVRDAPSLSGRTPRILHPAVETGVGEMTVPMATAASVQLPYFGLSSSSSPSEEQYSTLEHQKDFSRSGFSGLFRVD